MKSQIVSSRQEDTNNWYITFLKDKEKELVNKSGFKRVKTQKKVFYNENGKFEHNFTYVQSPNGLISPLREYLGIKKNKNMSDDFKKKLIAKASRTTYQKAVEDIYDSFGFWLSRKTLNRYVLYSESGVDISEEPRPEEKILTIDGTKAKSKNKGQKHNIRCVMSLDHKNKTSSLLSFNINSSPEDISKGIDLSQFTVLVADGEPALQRLCAPHMKFQLCHPHAIRDLSFRMWQSKMDKKLRKHYTNKLEVILYILQNSTKKYWIDYDNERLIRRILKTKDDLKALALEFKNNGKFECSSFISDHINHLVTAAEMALLGVHVPWTSNNIERLMQEVGIRTKKKGMNWTEKGLRAILNIVLKRYFTPKNERIYKNIVPDFTQEVIGV